MTRSADWAAHMKVWPQDLVEQFHRDGWWDNTTLSETVARWAAVQPEATAYVDGADGNITTWAGYHADAEYIKHLLRRLGVRRGQPVGVLMEDRSELHAVLVGIERAGAVAFVFPHSLTAPKLADLTRQVDVRLLFTGPTLRGRDMLSEVALMQDIGDRLGAHVVIDRLEGQLNVKEHVNAELLATEVAPYAPVGADELFLVNFTSGTTGRPKAVMHTQNRWKYFHLKCPHLLSSDRYLTCVSAASGMGLWSSHFTPLLVGARTVLLNRFDADQTLRLIEDERISVLVAVPTHLRMLLGSPSLPDTDLSSLRTVHSGGERLPFELGSMFEEGTGAKVLQFYGSNEAGCVSGPTRADDDPEQRLATAGKIIPEMNVRLVDLKDEGRLFSPPGRGRCAVRGPGMSPGYFGDEAANRELFRPDGWMLLGDIVEVDSEGVVEVAGRVSDFIIRGGQNISAGEVEDAVLTHPDVLQAAAVAFPDPLFGERVCIYAVTSPEKELSLDGLLTHLEVQGVHKTLWPERFLTIPEMPIRNGKIAKGELRQNAKDLAEQDLLPMRGSAS